MILLTVKLEVALLSESLITERTTKRVALVLAYVQCLVLISPVLRRKPISKGSAFLISTIVRLAGVDFSEGLQLLRVDIAK